MMIVFSVFRHRRRSIDTWKEAVAAIVYYTFYFLAADSQKMIKDKYNVLLLFLMGYDIFP